MGRGKCWERGEGYAATDYSSVQRGGRKTKHRGRKKARQIFFFFCHFLNYPTIKRGTKSHQFSFSTIYTALKSLKNESTREGCRRGFLFFFLFFKFFF